MKELDDRCQAKMGNTAPQTDVAKSKWLKHMAEQHNR